MKINNLNQLKNFKLIIKQNFFFFQLELNINYYYIIFNKS